MSYNKENLSQNIIDPLQKLSSALDDLDKEMYGVPDGYLYLSLEDCMTEVYAVVKAAKEVSRVFQKEVTKNET